MDYIIDISHYQGVEFNNMAALKSAGVVAVILKATQGLRYVDPEFHQRKEAAQKAGLLVGAYHFGVLADAKKQLEHFVSTAGDDVLHVLDVEDYK